jgi:sialate O-acetylesterase
MTIRSIILRLILTVPALFTSPLLADAIPNPLFTDGAVLQRDRPIAVWGTAQENEPVTVEFNGHKQSTTATNGKWKVNFQPMQAGGPFTMTITSNQVVTLNNLLIGDVWLCSGQSNMHFQMKSVENAKQEIAGMNHPKVRFFTVKHQFGQQPTDQTQGTWNQVSPSTAPNCSAVACYFGTALNQHLNIPIGLIISSVGGTRIESWMRQETLAKTGESLALIKKWSEISPTEFKRIGEEYSAFQHQRDHVHPNAVRKARAQGKPIPPPPVQPKNRCHDCPSALHNGMIAPLLPYAIRGAIWYQGESNAGQPKPYQKLLPAMILDWRTAWETNLPFLFVQIAPHRSIHPSFREAQHLIWQNTPNTAMVVTTDVGNMENIHPTQKRPVGERLALAARTLSYGEKIVSSGPLFEQIKIVKNQAVITFCNVGTGLLAKDGDLKGFTIAGDDGKFLPAAATIQDNSVIVTSDKVTRPTAVRYNWSIMPEGNLFNRENLPAAPFRSDGPMTQDN